MTTKNEKIEIKEELKKKKKVPISGRRLSGTGYVCVQTDREEFRSIPSVLVHFEKELSKKQLVKALTDHVVSVPKNFRLRCRLNEYKNRFIEIPDFAKKHLPKMVRIEKLNSDEDLYRIIERDIFKPFLNDSVLWEVIVFQNYSKGGCIVWFRNHHALGDGVSLTQTYIEMCAEKYTYREIMKKKYKHVTTWWYSIKHYFWLIISFLPVIFFFIWNFVTIEPKLHKKISSVRKNINFMWDKAFAIKDLKKIGKKYKLTINEIFIALISDALSEYYDPKKKKVEIRISVPVNCRTYPLARKMCNRFGVSWVSIPISKEMKWSERVKKVKKSSKFMKRWPFHHYMYYFSSFISPLFPVTLIKSLLSMMSSNYQSLNMSNVFGSPIELTLKDSKIKDMVFFIPAAPSGSCGFSVLSYHNHISLGLVSDRLIVKEPKKIIKRIEMKYKELLKEVKDE